MKKISVSITLLAMAISVFAYDKPVPGDTPLISLPKSSRIIAMKNIRLKCNENTEFCRSDYIGGEFSIFYSFMKNSEKPADVKIGEVMSVKRHDIPDWAFILFFERKPGGARFDFSKHDGPYPLTVNDFHNRVGAYFSLVYDDPDPYPGMDKSIVRDIVMKKITDAIKSGEYSKALPEFTFLETQSDKLPESFYYYYTESLEKTGKKAEAREHANDYLKRYGKGGKYYSKVIEIISRL